MADTPIIYGSVHAALKSFLEARLTVRVYPTEPNPRPASFVTMERAGGTDLSPVHDSAAVMVDSWAKSIAEAEWLAQQVRAHLHSIRNDTAAGVLLYAASPSGGIVWMPDPDSNTPRFRQNWAVVTRGIPA